MNRMVLVSLGVVLLVAGLAGSLIEWASGAQPWGQLLGDNFVFARTLPFTIGLGIVVGYWKALGTPLGTARRTSDRAIRRFAQTTVLLHYLAAASLVLLIATGGWQYLKGLLAAETPVYMGTVYRVHYFAASVLIFVTAAFVTDWWMRGERALLPGKGQAIRTLRGLAHELPKPFGSILAYGLGLDLRRPAPPTDQFTYYERTISFPLWELSIALIILTGAIKAVRYVYPIPGDVLYWVSAVHVGAGVLLSMKLLDHLRYVFAPSRWPLMAAMATGWIPERYAQRYHPGWYARLNVDSPALAATTKTSPSPLSGSAGGAAS